MKLASLGGISTRCFLRDYWQKKPLLVRQAFPSFNGLLTPDALFHLTCRNDVESRIISHSRSGWRLLHGPFAFKKFSNTSKRNWTLLIQDLNHVLPEAAALLQQFSFIPHARVDDLMASYAVPDGGVGPHFDSYDVFLLQGHGRRRWGISAQKNLDLIPDAALKLLKKFQPEQEWILEPGDMLYLPPHYAHEGVALTQCMTYSIGFRAPSAEELGNAFLGHLQDNLSLEGRYQDSDLSLSHHPGEISKHIVNKAVAILRKIRWDETDVANFLGVYLSEPKPHVFFAPPVSAPSTKRFTAAVAKHGIKLALKSRMLYRKNAFYLNGERFDAPRASIAFLRELADNREAKAIAKIDESTLTMLMSWLKAGFVEIP